MSRAVFHKQVYKKGPFGGTMNTTLCRRLRAAVEHNVAIEDAGVTCKFCLALMQTETGRTAAAESDLHRRAMALAGGAS